MAQTVPQRRADGRGGAEGRGFRAVSGPPSAAGARGASPASEVLLELGVTGMGRARAGHVEVRSRAHSVAHLLVHLLAHPLAQSLSHSLTLSFIHLLAHSLIHSLTCRLTCSILHSFTRLLTHPLACLLIHLLTYLLTRSLTFVHPSADRLRSTSSKAGRTSALPPAAITSQSHQYTCDRHSVPIC